MIKTMTAETVHFAIAEKLKSGATYIEALCEYAASENIEIETLAAVIRKSEVLKAKVKNEATDLRMIKRDPNEHTICD